MVGRERELSALASAFEQAVASAPASCSRSSGRPASASRGWRPSSSASLDDALVVRGRCLPYGEGITYWPVVEVVEAAPEATSTSRQPDDRARSSASEQIVTSSEEIAWAFRKLLEAVAPSVRSSASSTTCTGARRLPRPGRARRRPLPRRADPAALHGAAGAARPPDRLGRRQGQRDDRAARAARARGDGAADREPARQLDEPCGARISEAAEGNPLFVEEMVALVQESGDGEVAVPPTIQALLAARLDQLDPPERDVLECGSVEGRVFHRGAVQALAPDEPS